MLLLNKLSDRMKNNGHFYLQFNRCTVDFCKLKFNRRIYMNGCKVSSGNGGVGADFGVGNVYSASVSYEKNGNGRTKAILLEEASMTTRLTLLHAKAIESPGNIDKAKKLCLILSSVSEKLLKLVSNPVDLNGDQKEFVRNVRMIYVSTLKPGGDCSANTVKFLQNAFGQNGPFSELTTLLFSFIKCDLKIEKLHELKNLFISDYEPYLPPSYSNAIKVEIKDNPNLKFLHVGDQYDVLGMNGRYKFASVNFNVEDNPLLERAIYEIPVSLTNESIVFKDLPKVTMISMPTEISGYVKVENTPELKVFESWQIKNNMVTLPKGVEKRKVNRLNEKTNEENLKLFNFLKKNLVMERNARAGSCMEGMTYKEMVQFTLAIVGTFLFCIGWILLMRRLE